jgi:hypothetical protein
MKRALLTALLAVGTGATAEAGDPPPRPATPRTSTQAAAAPRTGTEAARTRPPVSKEDAELASYIDVLENLDLLRQLEVIRMMPILEEKQNAR